MSDTEILPCPFCGQVPTTFDTTGNGKWGFVQCCINGPEVRASYAPLEEWRDRAIAEWNDRKPAQLAATASEPDVSYEIVQDGMVVAGTSGSDALREIMHYAIQYQQDGPLEIAKVARTVLYAAPQGEGK